MGLSKSIDKDFRATDCRVRLVGWFRGPVGVNEDSDKAISHLTIIGLECWDINNRSVLFYPPPVVICLFLFTF